MTILCKSIGALTGLFITWRFAALMTSWRNNVEKAKRSGVPYIITPWNLSWLPWQIGQKALRPIITLFPRSLWEEWLEIMSADYSFKSGHSCFERKGSDTILMVAPYQLFLVTCNAEAVRTIANKRQAFPKWIEKYDLLRVFGENVLCSEGATWKMHRKITSASFNEQNAALVFRETILQTRGMINKWTTRDAGNVIQTLEGDTMRLALNIIGYVGFGLRLKWPGQSSSEHDMSEKATCESLEVPPGHILSFVDTLQTVLEQIFLLLIFPAKLLHKLPSKKAKLAGEAHDDYVKYMNELLDQKTEQAKRGTLEDEGMDLMGQLVRSSYNAAAGDEKAISLSRDEIIGNAFIMLVAGHETSANVIHFAIAELAINPKSQRRLQKDLDELLGTTDPDHWDYEALVGPLMGSMAGATMNETLRLLPPAVSIPKVVTPEQDQMIHIDASQHILPAGTAIGLEVCAIHRNPRYWPTQPSRVREGQSDIADWVPERWLLSGEGKEAGHMEMPSPTEEDYGGFKGPDTSAQLFRPERGAFIPFGDGPRACLGRRIAQVEIIAALAVIFRDYSVELAVEDDDGEDEATRYKAAQGRGRKTLETASSVVTLNLHGVGRVPIRLVRRGEEKFVSWVDN